MSGKGRLQHFQSLRRSWWVSCDAPRDRQTYVLGGRGRQDASKRASASASSVSRDGEARGCDSGARVVVGTGLPVPSKRMAAGGLLRLVERRVSTELVQKPPMLRFFTPFALHLDLFFFFFAPPPPPDHDSRGAHHEGVPICTCTAHDINPKKASPIQAI